MRTEGTELKLYIYRDGVLYDGADYAGGPNGEAFANPIVLTRAPWSASLENFPRYDENGREYVYTVEENAEIRSEYGNAMAYSFEMSPENLLKAI